MRWSQGVAVTLVLVLLAVVITPAASSADPGAPPPDAATTTATTARSFSDVPPGHPFVDDITWMAAEGIADGFPDGTFRPAAPVTRQAMAAFMRRLSDVLGGPTTSSAPGFSDVPSTHPFYDDIAWMVHHGVTTGFPDGTYRPTAPVTRQAMAAFMQRLSDLLGGPTETGPPAVSDVPTTHPFYDEIAWMVHSEVSTGFDDGTFRPAAAVTRQAMAAFMHRLADLLGGSDSICLTQSQIPVVECRALEALHAATDGPGWWRDDGWRVGPEPCNWWGLACVVGAPGSSTPANVMVVMLPRNDLTGRLPSQLRNLTALERLDLADNDLTGPLPAALLASTELQHLDLDGNALSGPLPADLAQLAELRTLHLGGNEFEGSIPASWGDLTNLHALSLYDNSLSGPIPSTLGNLTALRSLDLDGNALSGTIPAALGNLVALEILSLDHNALSGTVPASLGNLAALRWLTLNDNSLDGLLPPQLTSLSELVTLRLRNNGCFTAEEGGLTFLHWLRAFDAEWDNGC